MENRKRLDQDKVTTYAKLNAEIDRLEARRIKLRDKLIPKMEHGYLCPTKGPYLLELNISERQTPAWKRHWQRLAKKQYGPEWRKVMKRIISSTPAVPVSKLLVKVNPRYRQSESTNVVEMRHRGAA